ncbi:MAG: DUF5103 domain-containing protein [Cytophagales bacterium]
MKICLAFVFLLFSISSLAKLLRFEDFTYEEGIKSIQFYQKTGEFDEQTTFPAVSVEFSNILQLAFDELKPTNEAYYFRIVHCNGDWTKSNLIESEYLDNFVNDNLITTYSLSFNTKVKYVHYAFKIPKVSISGNYLVVVNRGSDQNDLILSRRFIVYSNKINIIPLLKTSQSVEERFTHQQIDFGISYNGYPNLFIPQEEIKVVIRQNGRWDNAIANLKPLYVRDGEKYLDYSFFNLENNFAGGNEFRQFDCRKIRTNGLNINYIELRGNENNVYLMQEKSRNGTVYALYFDANGKFIVGNNEAGGNLTDPDYVHVNFDFKTSEMPFGSIYVLGGFNDYKYNDNYKLVYDSQSDSYKCKTLLKQAYYNYFYAVKDYKSNKGNESELEGSFFQTENFYEIIVYHKPIGERSDFIVGYYSVKYNTTK